MNVSTVTICDLSYPDDLSRYRAVNLGRYVNDLYGDYCCFTSGWNNNNLELTVCEENSKDIIMEEKDILSLLGKCYNS